MSPKIDIPRWILNPTPPHSPDSHHDYKMYKLKYHVLSDRLLNFYNLRYIAVQKNLSKQINILPYKKKKGMLTDSQKEWSKLQSKIRIKVEYAISKIKNLTKWRIEKQ